MNICSTSTQENCTTERDACIIEMLDKLRGMVYNFARRYELEFDDCLQMASLTMLEIWPHIPSDCLNVGAYLNSCVRHELYEFLRTRGAVTLSLDAPVAEDSTKTFADMLEAFAEQDTRRQEQVTKTVHGALRKLSLEVQLYARDYYGMGGYTPVLPRSHKVVYGREPRNIRQSLRTAFRKNPQVLALVQHEASVL